MFGEKGLVQVYTGSGKGKSTAAFGMAVRAAGHGAKTAIVQFMKGWDGYGELQSLPKIEGIMLLHTGRSKCIFKGDETREDYDEAARGLEAAAEFMASGKYDLVILDEVNVATDFGLLDAENVLAAVRGKAPHTEVIMTGRNAPASFIENADLVTEMKEIKHPYQKGITAREGAEF